MCVLMLYLVFAVFTHHGNITHVCTELRGQTLNIEVWFVLLRSRRFVDLKSTCVN